MLTFIEFVRLWGRNSGYKKGSIQGLTHVSDKRLRDPDSLRLGEIKRIRDLLGIPQRDIERYVLEQLRG